MNFPLSEKSKFIENAFFNVRVEERNCIVRIVLMTILLANNQSINRLMMEYSKIERLFDFF